MNVLLGVSGGVAVYKAAELVRELQRNQIDVQVAMTRSAEEFVRPLTFASLSGKQVLTSLWQPVTAAEAATQSGDFAIEHIAIAQSIDALVIAPATANMLAKMAHGIADDLITTIYLATKAPVLVAPSMNVNMWEHPATQANVKLLRESGVRVIEPDSGYLACGMTGDGRLANITTIAEEVMLTLQYKADLAGETILITAGGTREPIDPVRYIGNRSSGKMGHALAEAAAARGAKVILVTAATVLPSIPCEIVRVDTAGQMRASVLAALPRATIVIKAAAVSDYRVREVAAQKLKRADAIHLELQPTEDIIQEITRRRAAGTLVVAFAAETEHLLEGARSKLVRKGVDAIVANDVSSPESGFDVDRNAGFFITSTAEVLLPESTKRVMADRILDQIAQLRAHQTSAREHAIELPA